MNSENIPDKRIRFPFFIAIIPIAFIMAALVQWLWNAILPELIHVGQLTYWKALGLLILCRILFGGFRGGPPRGKPPFANRAWREKWISMSEEERARFKEQWRQRCGRKDQ
ncbi:MAG: hypothetical protein KF746_05680 [Chitinophagaceae bacterium]|nr:hypothetical protein [Chitinophagaceae bacterium]